MASKEEANTAAAADANTAAAAASIDVEVVQHQQEAHQSSSTKGGTTKVMVVEPPRDDDNTKRDAASSAKKSSPIRASSDVSDLNRHCWVVTTAGLPWRTGTAVNPLLRALYLTRGRNPHQVTLMIPWLGDDSKSQKKLYGQVFANRKEQEKWIRQYCIDRCGCKDEEGKLRIMFYDGIYHEAFGSIFATEDIVSLIPFDEADVAILEEPEHLNWFRVPSSDDTNLSDEENDKNRLGWSHKFRHVVGILHTNYAAYVKQYGMGSQFLAAPALNGLSSTVVKAYCNRVIRLSDTLPSLDAKKEVTCNVHGVRQEFLDTPAKTEKQQAEGKEKEAAKVYFIGKLIWAKGFHNVLQLQDKVKGISGEYFAMDIYGGGNDQAAIERGFFGRKMKKRRKSSIKKENSEEEEGSGEEVIEEGEDEEENEEDDEEETETEVDYDEQSENQVAVAEVFGKRESLREQVTGSDVGGEETKVGEKQGQNENVPLDIVGDLSGRAISTGAETADAAYQLLETSLRAVFGQNDDNYKEVQQGEVGDGEKAEGSEKDIGKEQMTSGQKQQKSFPFSKLVPRRARYKWRKEPIPAKFLGVKDHIVLRDLPEQYIFLNMSTSEVLCTTTAEALAMGKFVIIPKHPSNEFFFQFPNCLAYNSIDDCVTKLLYALKSEPEPLSEKHSHILSWEGATERLYDASSITEEEWKVWEETGVLKEDENAAKFHVESGLKSQFVKNLFSGKILKQSISNLSAKSSNSNM